MDFSQSCNDTTSLSLIDRVRHQSADAWRRLVDVYGPVVYRWCRRAGLAAEDADDIGQDVFQAVATHIAAFRRDQPGDSFRGWLWTITRNKVRDHFRRAVGEPDAVGGSSAQQLFAQIPEVSDDSSSLCDPNDDRRLVIQGVMNQIRQEIEEKTWTVFWRTTVDGHAATDVARELGMTAKAVRQAKYRVLQRLREELAGLEEFL